METLGQCMYEWMHAEDITVGQLAEKLGYKSKTSLFRLLHGKSNYQSCVQFFSLMTPHLDECWQHRFQKALLTEKYGKSHYALMEAIYQRLFSNGNIETDTSRTVTSESFSGGTVSILGCTRNGIFRFIDELLSMNSSLRVVHYFTLRDLFNSPSLLPGLISHVLTTNYSAVLLDEADLYNACSPWNVAFWADDTKACIMLMENESDAWQPLSGGTAQAQKIIRTINACSQTELYRNDHLATGKDYIDFTEQNYRMERNRKTLILKPSPGMQMLPADIVEHSFIDFLAGQLEPISAARNTLMYIYEKRVKNFYSHSKPTYLMLSFESMIRFARDGVLDDQFFACRPFTETERIEIFQNLQTFSQNENVHVSFCDHPSWPVSVEAYDGIGVLFYPSSSNYHTSHSVYRELFLPGKEFSDLLFQFAEAYGFFDDSSLKDSCDLFRKLQRTANMAK